MNKAFNIILFSLGLTSIFTNANAKEELKDIVVTASATNEVTTKLAPATIDVVNIDKSIKTSIVENIGDLIDDVSGISVTTNSNGTKSVNVRGLSAGITNSYVLTLINGDRTYSDEAEFRGSDSVLSYVPFIAIDRIEVVKGAISSLYGSDAGGVVNVITKKNQGITEGAISIEGKYNDGDKGGSGEQVSIYFTTPLNNKLSWTSYGNIINLDETYYKKSPSNTKIREQKNINFTNILDWNLADDKELELSALISKQNINANSVFGNRKFDRDKEKLTVKAKYKQYFGEENFFRFKSFYETFKITYNDINLEAIKEDTMGLETNVDLNFDKLNVMFGANIINTKLDNPSQLKNSPIDVTNNSLFTEFSYFITPTLNMILGTRYENSEAFNSVLSSRAYLVKEINENWSIKGGVSESFKRPKIGQYNDNFSVVGCAGRCIVFGNSKLTPEKGLNKEIVIDYTNVNTNFNIAFFENKIEDKFSSIPIDPTKPRGNLTYSNISKAQIKGVELNLKNNLSDVLSSSIALTYLDTKDLDKNTKLPNVAKHNLSLKLDYNINNNIEVFSKLKYKSSQLPQVRNNPKVKPYTTVDLGMRYSLNDIDIKFGVNNIGNKEISTPESYSEIIRGRTFYAGLTKYF